MYFSMTKISKFFASISIGLTGLILLANTALASCDLVQEGNTYQCPSHLSDPADTQFFGSVITYFDTVVCTYLGDDGNTYDCHSKSPTPGGYVGVGSNWIHRADNMYECGYIDPEDPSMCSFQLATTHSDHK